MYKLFLCYLFVLVFLGCKEVKADPDNQMKDQSVNVAATPSAVVATKNAEIVFCLDATGSMSGLIGTAKEKIWDIVSDLAQSSEIDTLRMGMIFYRDRGDVFVTKSIPLSTDLDSAYVDLLDMSANGGGDTPESVNQALDESVHQMIWSKDQTTYRTIFVIGDCPPHMDYQDDTPYTISCVKAAEKGIVINTIKLGNTCQETIPHFKKMAACGDGAFLQLDQNATDYVVATPYDEVINDVSKDIDNSRLYYGNKKEQLINNEKKAKSMEVYDKSSSTANSARASYKISKSGAKAWMGSKEIVADYKNNNIDIEMISEDELPEVLQGKTIVEKKRVLQQITDKRTSDIKRLKELNEKRKAYIRQKANERSDSDSLSFSKEVVKIMTKQANEK